MNLLKNFILNKSTNVKIKKQDGKVYIENKSNKREYLIFSKLIFTNRKNFKLINSAETISGEDYIVKIVNRKLKIFAETCQNGEVYFPDIPKVFMIGISLSPKSKYRIDLFEYEKEKSYEEKLEDCCTSDILLLTTGYPSKRDKYNTSFVHSRVVEYEKNKVNVDVIVANENYITMVEFSEFEGKKVIRTGYNQVRNLLLKKKYKKILVHFIRPAFLRIFDAVDMSNTQIFLYSHGVDTLYNHYEKIGAPYDNVYEIPSFIAETFEERDELIKRFNNRDNVMFVFGSKWNKDYAEKLLDLKFNNYSIIPNFVDEKLYNYKSIDPELRKKIFVIRPQNDLKSYAMDINVRTILELSRRECFKDMEFSIYGTGTEHDWIVKPLERFDNVHIYNKFLSHEEIAQMHKENGIGLFASRFDTMGVSACEAAMSGKVVITSKGIGTEEYIDSKLGTYCETENYKEYADIIEKLYNDPDLYVDLCEKMRKSVLNTCSSNHSIKKDIELIKSFDKNEEITIPTIKKHPLLSISIAGYNISNFVIQLVTSLLRAKHADELEILVVNDGSKDDTVEKITKFVKKHYKGNGDPVVRVIDKENGGHGSTINKGLELATGKYFKLLDGDDYFVSEELDKLIEILKTSTTDLIITDYITDLSVEGSAQISHNCSLEPGVEYNLDDSCFANYGFTGEIKWGPQLHTATYKTKLLQDMNFKIDEKCFYVDMEYNLMGLLAANTVKYYPLHIYSYYIGREGQSVSTESFRKNVFMHEKVCLRLIEEVMTREVSIGKRTDIITNMIEPLCKFQYSIVVDLFKNSEKFKSFDSKLKKYPQFYNDNAIVTKKTRLYRKVPFLIRFNKVIKIFLRDKKD